MSYNTIEQMSYDISEKLAPEGIDRLVIYLRLVARGMKLGHDAHNGCGCGHQQMPGHMDGENK
jgi:hypothetical protein